MSTIEKIGFGGGCHWCTEGVFQSVIGVVHVDQGWVYSDDANGTGSEGVIVGFDLDIISLEVLIEIHLLSYSSFSNHSMRNKYRSAIYYFNQSQLEAISCKLKEYQLTSKDKIITQALPLVSFEINQEKYLNYYKKNPEAPFCERHIFPKIQKLLKTHGSFLKEE